MSFSTDDVGTNRPFLADLPPTPPRRAWWPSAVGAAVVMALVGLGLGQVWRIVAPRFDIVRVEQGFVYGQSQPEQGVAADGWFAFLGFGAGLILAVLAWVLLRQRRGWPVLAALVLGSVVGGWLGWWAAVEVDRDRFEAAARAAEIGTHVEAPLMLGTTGLDPRDLWPPKANGVVLAQALGAAIVYTTLAGFAVDPHLRPGRGEPNATEASSGPGEAAGPPMWQAQP